STIGEQRRTNYALQAIASPDVSVDDFVAMVTEDQPAAPAYFVAAAVGNRKDRPILDEDAPVPVLDLAAVDAARAEGAVIVDLRPTEEVARGYLAGSVAVGLGGRFAEQVGSVVPVGSPVVLVGPSADDPREAHEAVVRLSRIGFDDVVGVLPDIDAVLADHPDRAARLSRLTAEELADRRSTLGDDVQVVDVRNSGEVHASPLDGTAGEGARNLPLASLRSQMDQLDPGRPVVAVCAGGARSAIAATLLASEGFTDVSDVLGGAGALGVAATCSISAPCPTGSLL
ncbi:MAG: rhodanese-like domain-containing protein, partial [Acidimicrobiales bacterium]|nr:rhodanese-like domain-containing protein [Acidimicrobiales bacterium]